MANAANVGAPDSSWRDVMTREDRIKVCQHIMQKLSTYYQMVPEQALREKTSAFESQAYTHAESRTDYLRRIAGGLSNVERQSNQQSVATASTNNPGGAGGGGPGVPPGTGGATSSAVSRQAGPPQGSQSYTEQMQNQLLLQKQQAAAVAKGRSKQAISADSKVANARTRSSSSSVVAEGTSRSKHGPTKTSSQNAFNGMNGMNQVNGINGIPGDASGFTPDMLLAFQQSQNANSQQSRFAMQQQVAAAAARQQRGQVNPNAAVAGLAMAGALKQGNAAAIAAAARVQQQNSLNTGNPGNPAANIPGFFPGTDRKLSPEQLNQFVNNMVPGNVMPPGAQGGVGGSAALSMSGMQRPQQQNRLTAAMIQQMRMGVNGGAPSNASFDARARQNAAMNQMNPSGGVPVGSEGFPGNAAYNSARMKAPSPSGPLANPGQAMVHAADSEEFWVKLEEMKAKYREPLKKMFNFMTIIANSQRPEKKEQFKKHLKDCFQILGLKRGQVVPPTLTTAVLETASKFIDSVINVYKNYIVNEQRAAQAAQAGKNSTQSGANSQASRVSAQQQFAIMQNSQNAAEGGPQAQQEMFRKLQQQQYQQRQEQAAAGMGGAMGDSATAKAAAAKARTIQQNMLARSMRQNPSMPQQFNPQNMGMPGMKKDHRALMEMKMRQQAQQHRMAALHQGQQMPPTYQRHLAAVAGRDPKSSAAAQAGGVQHIDGGANANLGRQMVNNLHMQQMAIHQKRQQAARKQQQLENEMNGPGNQNNQSNHSVMAQIQRNQTAAKMAADAAAAAKRASGNNNARVAEFSLEKRMLNMQHIVENALKQTLRWEQYVENDSKRSKAERIQNTLAALRNVSGGRSNKRPSSLVDVENCNSSTSTVSGGNDAKEKGSGNGNGRIRSKSVFECSSEQGLRLAKRPKNEASDLKALREAVEADCKAAQRRNGLLEMTITEEFGQPVVACQLLIEEIRVPKLILRVQRGYPRKGGATYSFERPPLGWVGILEEIRCRFKRAVQNAPATSVGVAALLDAWAREAESVIENQIRDDDDDDDVSEEETAAAAEIDMKRNVTV